ncbi:alpha/beta fold hydrolase, partial [Synechococcus sp. EJ6-Ellesmere]|uniref:alpha/beta fold hydrolase n=1 Tax=Synechococcus sp. EJ6-Ellesmere TaxID=2823734 RepID=UPI0020CFD531
MSRFPQAEWCQGPELIARAASNLLDPQGRDLAGRVQWWELPGFSGRWPVAVLGEGKPLLLLHGFDSSLLEFRRLAPLLAPRFRLYIPDLYGFGFSPRPAAGRYNPSGVLDHLTAVVEQIEATSAPGSSPPLGVIGASMGGSVAVELARRLPLRGSR